MIDARILIVEDERSIAKLLKTVLLKEGFRYVDTVFTAQEAIEACNKMKYHLIVMDVMLPDGDGFQLTSSIRSNFDIPILFLSARTTDLDKLKGFSLGGDDYITKPFNPLEVVARIQVHLKRSQRSVQAQGQKLYDYGRFQLNEESAELIVCGHSLPCSAMLYQLLLFFCQHPNRVFTREELYEKVWGSEHISDNNTVMVHIRRLREKIEKDPSQPEYLVTVRGIGYKLVRLEKKDER